MEGMIERLEAMLAKGTDNMLLRFSLGKAYAEQDCFPEAETHLRAALAFDPAYSCLLYTSPSPRDGLLSRMPSSA